MTAPSGHFSFETLLDYWLRDTDAAATEAIDEHLMRCDTCGEVFDELVALGSGVREAFRAGHVAAVVPEAFLTRLRQQGLRIREYRLPHNGSVNCSVAPDDELLVSRLAAPLAGVKRLDAVTRLSLAPDITHQLHDIPFDAQAGQVFFVQKLAEVRQQPRNDMTLTLVAHDEDGERELGRYVFHHYPWAGQ
jgi:hypothetical protein